MLNELEEILEATPSEQLEALLVPIFERLAACIANQHFQVAERALFFWNNDLVSSLTADHKDKLYPIIVPPLHRIKQMHWNNTVHSLSLNVTRMLTEMDNNLYQAIANKQVNQQKIENLKNEKRSAKWLQIESIAAAAAKR